MPSWREIIQAVESGEGIESCVFFLLLPHGFLWWNPEKELKANIRSHLSRHPSGPQWNPEKELKEALRLEAGAEEFLAWNPEKELKDIRISKVPSNIFTHLPLLWNPEKELKDIRIRDDVDGGVFTWNPEKELKVEVRVSFG